MFGRIETALTGKYLRVSSRFPIGEVKNRRFGMHCLVARRPRRSGGYGEQREQKDPDEDRTQKLHLTE